MHAERIEEELARDRVREIAARKLDELNISELYRLAKKREVIGAAPGTFGGSGDLQCAGRLSEKIERDVGERDVLLENWPVRAPLGETVAEYQPVIAEPERVIEKRVRQNPFRPRGIL